MKRKKIISVFTLSILLLSSTLSALPVFAQENKTTSEINFDMEIPYQTYDEFVKNLTITPIDKIPNGESCYNSIYDFYLDIYSNTVTPKASVDKVANKKFGDLSATFYGTIADNTKIIYLNHVSSSVSPIVIGANWTQESFDYQFLNNNHVVSGNIYGRLDTNIITPIGFIKIATKSYKVPFEVSASEFK